jgi:Ca2+-binding RTX toxin-like protein
MRVRATDRAGNVDPTPASRTFTVDAVDVGVSGSTLVVAAGEGAKDNLKITRPSPSTVRITDFAGGAYTGSGVQAGIGCSPNGDHAVNCSAAGITLIEVFSHDRNDQIINSTTIQASLNGGGANDTVIGGGANDTLSGGAGADLLKGRNGSDLLLTRDSTSETAINCDGGAVPGGADVAEVDELPHDPDSTITRCETVSRGGG